jgi:ABC-type multidrug transport system fused ATPase/permease subunit
VLFDNVDTRSVPVRELRQQVAVIPQDPVLFSGSIRSNLDRFGVHEDSDIWDCLKRVGMQQAMQDMDHGHGHGHGHDGEGDGEGEDSGGSINTTSNMNSNNSNNKSTNSSTNNSTNSSTNIDSSSSKRTAPDMSILSQPVAESGSNLSLGQRQLLCLVRALLRRARLVLLDEATSSVDTQTDALLQRAMRLAFKSRTKSNRTSSSSSISITGDATAAATTVKTTSITVAHRMNTIMDSDRVLVLDAGQVAEYDTPEALLAKPKSLFSQLVHET